METNFLKLRNEKKLSQQEVAKVLNITRQAYSRYERGEREANYETLDCLAHFYDVSIDYLLGRTIFYYPDRIDSSSLYAEQPTLEELVLINWLRKFDKNDRELVVGQIKTLSKKYTSRMKQNI